MSHQHCVAWIDHKHATIIDFSFDQQHLVVVERKGGQHKVHRRSGIPGSGKAAPDLRYFDEVAAALGDAAEVLLVGPGNAKLELHSDLQARHPTVAARIVGVEPSDHPSSPELLAFARKHFKRIDALRGDS